MRLNLEQLENRTLPSAAYGLGWQENSIALWPILWGLSLDAEGVVGGNSVTACGSVQDSEPPAFLSSSMPTLSMPSRAIRID